VALMGGVIRNANTHVALPFASACVTGTLTCYGTDGSGIWNNLRDNATTGYEGVNMTYSAGGFNNLQLNMVAADIAFFPGIGYGYWKIAELVPAPPPPTCFTGDTLVTMADGSDKPIAGIGIGELVLGQDGGVNRVLAVETPILGDRPLYALDDSAPFITNEHPLFTDRGWASIDPAMTAGENPDLVVVPLQVRDMVHRLHAVKVPALSRSVIDRAEIEIVRTPLQSITVHAEHPGITLYNLVLENDHTYFANGYLVHNKTPTH